VKKSFILFDNDGILVDTEKYYYSSSKEVLASVGLDLTPELFNEISLNQGVGVWSAFPGKLTEEQISQLRTKRDLKYRELLETEPLLVDGVEDVLKELSKSYRLAIITTALREDFETIHARTGLLKYFDFYLTNGDYPRSKPAPDPYLAGIQKIGLSVQEGIVVEDTLRGVRSAKAARLPVIAIPNSFNKNDDFSEADYKLRTITEILTLNF
jgi:HAD superfamily hydrolase (TIGR01509 family)